MTSPVSYQLVDEIGVITVNSPPVNALSQAVRQGLLDAIRKAQADASAAVLIHCDGRTFIAGADITEFGRAPAEPLLPDLLNEIEASDKLVVAALHGTALGGGFETALACHYRIALYSGKVGLPEVKLGLLPGAGGTQRVPRLASIDSTLDLILSGVPISANRAMDLGLVDKVVTDNLYVEAIAFTRQLLNDQSPIRRTSELDVCPVESGLFEGYRDNLARRARSQTAPQRIVDCIEAATTMPFAAGQQRERELFIQSMQDPQSRALQHMFFAERQAAKIDGLPRDTSQRDIKTIGIIGSHACRNQRCSARSWFVDHR